ALVRPFDDAALHVDDEECGVRPVVECGHSRPLLTLRYAPGFYQLAPKAAEIPTRLQPANADTEPVSNPSANHQEIHVNEALDFSLPPTTPSAAARVSAPA